MVTSLLKALRTAVVFFYLPALVYSGSVSTSEDAGWELVADDDGIKVYARSLANSPVREVRAITEISATPNRVFAVLLDSDHFVEFMPYIVEARTVARDSSSIWYLYQRISPPLVSDRDYTLEVDRRRNPDGAVEVDLHLRNDLGPPPAPKSSSTRPASCISSSRLSSSTSASARSTSGGSTAPVGLHG